MTLAVSGESITFNDNSVQATAPKVGMVNRIINGAMVIDQRNAGALVAVNGFSVYSVDRFLLTFRPSTGTATGQQVSDATSGFVNSLRMTQASVTAQATNDYYGVMQKVEGYNFADFNFGTSNAKTFTLSFWIKSSLTGTFGIAFQNNTSSRSYVTTYTINSANTWEQKTITVTGDTAGTWDTTNNSGLKIQWDLGSGSDYQTSSLNTWQSANYIQASTGVRWIAASGATWQVTGVQLEKGSTATSFDYRPYGTELGLCQRYFQTINAAPGVVQNGSSTTADLNFQFRVDMRATPTAAPAGLMRVTDTAGDFVQSSASISAFFGNVSGARAFLPNFTGLTALRPCFLRTDSAVIQLSAEL